MKRTFHRSTINRRIRKERIRLGFVAKLSENTPETVFTDTTTIAPVVPPENPCDETLLGLESYETVTGDPPDDASLLTQFSIASSHEAITDVPSAIKLFALQAKSVTAADLKLLLRLLNPLVPGLPLDPRTLRRTPRSCTKYNLKNSSSVHKHSALGISPPVLASSSKENIPNLGKSSVDSTLFAELRLIRSSLDLNTEELKNLRQDIDNIQSCVKSNTEKLLIIEPLMRNSHKFIITTPPVLPKESTEESSNFSNSLSPFVPTKN